MTVIRQTQFFDAEVSARRLQSGTVVVSAIEDDDGASIYFQDPEAFLRFAAEVARIAEAIEAERLHDAPKIRHPQCKPKSLEGWRG